MRRVLDTAYRTLADDVHRGEQVTTAAEWILDNFHLVASEIRGVRQNLPRGYYRELPKLATRELAGTPRVYALAVELIRHSDSLLERGQLVRFLNSFQSVAPLTIGELWAWPSMLRLALIENLRRLAAKTIEGRAARRAADAFVARIDEGGPGRAAAAASGAAHRLRGAAPAAHPRVRPAAPGDPHRGRRPPRRPRDERRGRHPRRAPGTGRRPGLGHQRHRQPAALLDARLERVLRGGEPGRAGAAAGSARRLRPHGLPEPRPLPAGGRGARRQERRRAAPGRAARRRERPRGGRTPARRTTARRTSATT
jgi:hypothetical protein